MLSRKQTSKVKETSFGDGRSKCGRTDSGWRGWSSSLRRAGPCRSSHAIRTVFPNTSRTSQDLRFGFLAQNSLLLMNTVVNGAKKAAGMLSSLTVQIKKCFCFEYTHLHKPLYIQKCKSLNQKGKANTGGYSFLPFPLFSDWINLLFFSSPP